MYHKIFSFSKYFKIDFEMTPTTCYLLKNNQKILYAHEISGDFFFFFFFDVL